jgi:hypothetical protein
LREDAGDAAQDAGGDAVGDGPGVLLEHGEAEGEVAVAGIAEIADHANDPTLSIDLLEIDGGG